MPPDCDIVAAAMETVLRMPDSTWSAADITDFHRPAASVIPDLEPHKERSRPDRLDYILGSKCWVAESK